eukprot:TRINITY_DN3027_c0_g2_i2.p1 TRINITY_DN3027_c0_g2~~TRINITY_DN3027_c0_g2_i2.p1  ORF type:complete len:107 (+),score=11.77 TRINITY_DN3027_c0_g2_i2:469-789(+)
MNQEELELCEKIFVEKEHIENPFQIFVNECPLAKGEFSVFPRILEIIEGKIKAFKSVSAKLDDYRLEAPSDRFDWLNILLSYYRGRLLVIRRLSKSILDFEKSQKL